MATNERITVYCPADHTHLGDLLPIAGGTEVVTCAECGTSYTASWEKKQHGSQLGLWSLMMDPPAHAVLMAPKDLSMWGLRR